MNKQERRILIGVLLAAAAVIHLAFIEWQFVQGYKPNILTVYSKIEWEKVPPTTWMERTHPDRSHTLYYGINVGRRNPRLDTASSMLPGWLIPIVLIGMALFVRAGGKTEPANEPKDSPDVPQEPSEKEPTEPQ